MMSGLVWPAVHDQPGLGAAPVYQVRSVLEARTYVLAEEWRGGDWPASGGRNAQLERRSTVFITADGFLEFLECDLAVGDCVVFDGALTPHGRTALGAGESVILVSFGFRARDAHPSARGILDGARTPRKQKVVDEPSVRADPVVNNP
ncbi:hypothetical protein [Kitasatospora sp. NPDC050463]|uniref:hypothetical protein n=1 Tax=Kitasatospora sp. NPDC050463 TaxID=3155786 RepID=UPI0033FD825E